MIQLGATLKCNQAPYHYWLVLSDPARTQGKILFVNITTLTDSKIDDECILTNSDFVLLDSDSVVAFSRHKIGSAAALENAVKSGHFEVIELPIPPATLSKILGVGRSSIQLSKAAKALLG